MRGILISGLICLAMSISFSCNTVFAMGDNGGTRLLLHVDERNLPDGVPTENPCEALPPVGTLDDMIVDYFGESDSVWIWTYLAHPRNFAIKGVGFTIEYEGVKVLTSGSCSPFVMQQPESMGTWAQNGSTIAFAWGPTGYPEGWLEPVSWFLVERLEPNGYFRVYDGTHSMSGEVGDANRISRADQIWAYGKIGFGEVSGELPMPKEEEIAGAAGAITISIQ